MGTTALAQLGSLLKIKENIKLEYVVSIVEKKMLPNVLTFCQVFHRTQQYRDFTTAFSPQDYAFCLSFLETKSACPPLKVSKYGASAMTSDQI